MIYIAYVFKERSIIPDFDSLFTARRIPVGLGCACALGTLGAVVKYTEVYKNPLPRREMP